MTVTNPHRTKTVVVLGAAYGGIGAAAALARRLPSDWRVVAIDRNTHANHVYPFPRFTVLNDHSAKSFIPLTKMLSGGRVTEFQANVEEKERTGSPLPPVNDAPGKHELVHGLITDLTPHSVTFVIPNIEGHFDDVKDDGSDAPPERVQTVDFDYCVYALGGALSEPSDAWGDMGRARRPGRGTKSGGMQFLARQGDVVRSANKILVVGGGALGIQFATDIKEVHPDKDVTLLHSRTRLMPIYHQGLHDEVVRRCGELGVRVVLGERVMEWPQNPNVVDGTPKVVKTDKGTELSADLVLVCTGTKPSVDFMQAIDKDCIAPNGCIRIKPTMQVRTEGADAGSDLDHFFAIGDCADTTAIRAGHMAFAMGSVAARNVLRLIEAHENGAQPDLEDYVPEMAKIKVTLGRKHNCVATPHSATPGDQGIEDLGAKGMWALAGAAALADDE